MSTLKRSERERQMSEIEQFEQELDKELVEEMAQSITFDKVVSTGSTLLDLAISGSRIRGGGLPGGIFVEIFGPAGSGKTAILVETAANAQYHGGDVLFLDPEARLDMEYSQIYGLRLKRDHYKRPDTVKQMFEEIRSWKPEVKKEGALSVCAADSLAALSTEMEMEGEDKMGMRRAKDFSEQLRKTMRVIANNNWIVFSSNQIRQGQAGGSNSPGGNAIKFYASLRIKITKVDTLTSSKTIHSEAVKKGDENVKFSIQRPIGIKSVCEVVKSSLDTPFRKVPLYLIFGYGIDDVRANLQWLKEVLGSTTYLAVDKSYKGLNDAVNYIEKNNYQQQLREIVINVWNDIDKAFEVNRPKLRW